MFENIENLGKTKIHEKADPEQVSVKSKHYVEMPCGKMKEVGWKKFNKHKNRDTEMKSGETRIYEKQNGKWIKVKTKKVF